MFVVFPSSSQQSYHRGGGQKCLKKRKKDTGELGDSNPRPPAPEAGIIPLDQIPRVLRDSAGSFHSKGGEPVNGVNNVITALYVVTNPME